MDPSKKTPSSKKVLIIFEEVIRSGLINVAGELSKILIQLNYDVHLIYAENKNAKEINIQNYFSHIKKDNLHTYKLKNTNKYLAQLEKLIKTWIKLFSFWPNKKTQYVYHCFLPASYMAVFLHPFAYKRRKFYHLIGFRDLEMLSVHRYLHFPYQKKFSINVRIRFFLLYFIQKICLKTANRIIAISHYVKKTIAKRYKIPAGKIQVIHCHFDSKTFNLNPKLNIRKQMGISKNTLFIGMVQRHDPRKGFYLFLKALWFLKKKEVRFHAIIAGDPTFYTPHIIKYRNQLGLKFYINFLTGLNKHEIAQFYNTIDLSIITSLDLETFGITIIEALACGRPVIGIPTGAIPEILNLVQSFELCTKNKSPKALADKIQVYINLPKDKKNEISEEAINIVNSKFSLINALKAYKNIY